MKFIKLQYNNILKKLTYNEQCQNWDQICLMIQKFFALPDIQGIKLYYIDSDNDRITVSSTEDLISAYKLNSDKDVLKFIVEDSQQLKSMNQIKHITYSVPLPVSPCKNQHNVNSQEDQEVEVSALEFQEICKSAFDKAGLFASISTQFQKCVNQKAMEISCQKRQSQLLESSSGTNKVKIITDYDFLRKYFEHSLKQAWQGQKEDLEVRMEESDKSIPAINSVINSKRGSVSSSVRKASANQFFKEDMQYDNNCLNNNNDIINLKNEQNNAQINQNQNINKLQVSFVKPPSLLNNVDESEVESVFEYESASKLQGEDSHMHEELSYWLNQNSKMGFRQIQYQNAKNIQQKDIKLDVMSITEKCQHDMGLLQNKLDKSQSDNLSAKWQQEMNQQKQLQQQQNQKNKQNQSDCLEFENAQVKINQVVNVNANDKSVDMDQINFEYETDQFYSITDKE